ncbi:MAG: hypothetical protein JWO56_439, partial [Acidobacteria bacterium]|nr:hypothetical protein [Acidobacteriota bacterium]
MLPVMKRLLVCLLILSCHEAPVKDAGHATAAKPASTAATPATASTETAPPLPFDQDVARWRETRRASLTKEDGWLSLVGLTWLNPGDNEVKMPTRPPMTTHFVLANGKVTLMQPGGGGNPIILRDDTDAKGPQVVHIGSFQFNLIKRNEKFGIRMKDANAETRKNFKGLDYFPPNPKWRIEAQFVPFNPPKKVPITNVLGMTSDEVVPGELAFNVEGKAYRVQPIIEQGEKDLFLIFKDATSGKETYGAARYLYARPAGADGKVIVDFNKSYNPPCAFTPYATCPLPPPSNRLPFAIDAGEKK